jgi:hypothetical protein
MSLIKQFDFDTHVWVKPLLLSEEVELSVHIYGINSHFLKKQWEQIWDDEVKPKINKYRKEELAIPEIGKQPRKITLERLKNQMEKWSEWYQLTKIQDLTAEEALGKWEEKHADELTSDDQVESSALLKAVKEFEEIITPLPI